MSAVTQTIELQAVAPHSLLRPTHGKLSLEEPRSSRFSTTSRNVHNDSTEFTADAQNSEIESVSSGSEVVSASLLKTIITISQPSLINVGF